MVLEIFAACCRKLPRAVVGEQTLCAEGGGGAWSPPHSCTDVSSAVGNLCGEVEWKRVSSDETDVAFFARWGVRREVFGVADHTKADAFDVGVDAPLSEEGFPLGAVEHLVGTVDPAGTPTEGVCGVEEVAHHERTVVEIGGLGAIGQNHHDNRGAVEGIAVAPENFGVEAREFVAHRAVGDHDDEGRLTAAACRGVGTGVGNALQIGNGGKGVGRKTLDAAPGE